MGRKSLLVLLLALVPALAQAQTVRTLCASGCTYTLTEANLTTAINASVGGDSILLQEGTTTDVALVLPAHTGASMVTIRTGVTSTGSLISSSQFPAADIRMTPALATSSNLAILRAKTNNTPAIRTASDIGSSGYWTLKHLAFTSNTYGGEALIQLGSDSDNTGEQDSIARIPAHFTVNQVYIYGNPVSGQFRGMRVHVNNWIITNNYIKDIKATSEGQAIYFNSFSSGGTLTNNYIEGGAEGVIFGGAGGCCHPDITVASAASASSFTLSGRTDLFVGLPITVANAGGVEEQVYVATCGTAVAEAACTSNAITVTPALSTTPSVGADVDWGIIPSDVTVEKNHFYKPPAWRSAIVGTPQSVAVVASTTGGTLAAGSYCYRVVARHPAAVNGTATSGASAQQCVTTTGSTGSVSITWAAVTNAVDYRVYGRSSGGQNIYWTVTAPTVTKVDTGASGTSGTVPTSSGTTWFVKNIFEIKNGRRITVNGNVFDGVWEDGQDGYAILFTPANTGNGNDSTYVGEIDFTNNIVRNAAGGMQIMGRGGQTARLKDLTISNNLFYDIGTAWGQSVRLLLITTYGSNAYWPNNTTSNGPLDVTVAHNSFLQTTGNALIWFDLYKTVEQAAENFVWRDNIGYKLNYGVTGALSCGQGDFTNATTTGCWTMHTTGTSVWQNNVVANVTCANYPGGCTETFAPTTAVLAGEFVDFAAGNFALKSTSTYHNAATDGTDIGANISTITALTNIALGGDNSGTVTVTAPPEILSPTVLSDSTVGATYPSATFAGTCVETPCVWTTSGTLPSGLTFTSVDSTSATLTGVGVEAGTYPITVILTDDDDRAASRDYIVTLTQIVPPEDPPVDPDDPPVDPDDPPLPVNTNRPDRFNMDDRVLFGRATEPSVSTPAEPVRTSDLWGDLSCSSPVLKLLLSTSPAVDWRSIAFRPRLTVTTIATAGVSTYSASEVIGGLILRDPAGSNRSDVTPTAAQLVAAIPCAEVGDVIEFDIRNTADAAETITVTAGTDVTLSGTMTIAQSNTRKFKLLVTNATSGEETVTIYSLGTVVH